MFLSRDVESDVPFACLGNFIFMGFFLSDYSRYYADYECNTPLLEKAVLKATSSMQDRGPENARLDSEFFFLLFL